MTKPQFIITGKNASAPEFAEFCEKYAGPAIRTPDLMGISPYHRAYIKFFPDKGPLLILTQPKVGEEKADEIIALLHLFPPEDLAPKEEVLVQ